MTKIQTASLEFQQNGTPVSTKFDDIYFSKDNGLEESHYVFQQGNHLVERWKRWQNPHFTIAETGFGTGLNFLAVCQAFEQFKDQNPNSPLKQLNFISFEKYPLNKLDLAKALAPWQMLSVWSDQLVEQYPYLIAGAHRIEFKNQIKLDLWLGDILTQLPQVADNYQGTVDAWFLDGFAPSKNSAMWHQDVFNHMARLAAPEGTLATFTAAGFVRRGLIDAGFDMQKRKGFGYKREMLTGQLKPANEQTQRTKSNQYASVHAPQYPQPASEYRTTCIVGSGIAAVCTALKLTERGHFVHLISQHDLADGASGNRQGAIYPLIQNSQNAISDCHLKSFEYARQFYQNWQKTLKFSADFCGLVQLAFSDKMAKRQQALLDNPIWPEQIFNPIPQSQMQDLTGLEFPYSGLHFADGGWLNPVSFIHSTIEYLKTQGKLKLSLGTELQSFEKLESGWRLSCEQHQKKVIYETENLILCQGWQLAEFEQTQHLTVEPSRGQVSHLKTRDDVQALKKVICHKGYLTPSWQQTHCVGATFEQNNSTSEVKAEDDLTNLSLHQTHTPNLANWLKPQNLVSSRASVRATTKDRLPMVGAISPVDSFKAAFGHYAKGGRLPANPAQAYPNLYVLAGLGSRGLTTAPFMAECLAALVNNEVIPLSLKTLEALHPNRFLMRDMKRGEI